MSHQAAESEPRPLTEAELSELEDGTLEGYLDTHSRPPAFYGSDGHPYTISVEWEQVGDLAEPYAGFLVFPRFARSGVGVVGHVETPFLWRGSSPEEVRRQAGKLTLSRVKALLEEAVARRDEIDGGSDAAAEGKRESEPGETPEC